MTQLTQFTVCKGPDSINVHPADLATYLAAGYTIKAVKYSEGAEAVDSNTQFLMTLGSACIYVHAADVQTYLAAGYAISKILYGSAQTIILASVAPSTYLDIPAFSSAEVGTVDATTVVVTFTTEIAASNYATGVVIKVATVSKTISAAVRQTGNKIVHYTIPAVTNGQAVTWEYSDVTGGILSANDGTPLDSVSAQTVTNNVA